MKLRLDFLIRDERSPDPVQEAAWCIRAVRHPYGDKLVPGLTVNGFGSLINCDEWELIHNPLCRWPCVLSGLQDAEAAHRGKLLPPVGPGPPSIPL